MKSNPTVILTTAFEQPKAFIDEYFSSLANQSRQDFDILIVNDGCSHLYEALNRYKDLAANIVSGVGNIAKNRQILINAALEMGYKYAVFADFDDYFSESRVADSLRGLESNDIVVNDLAIVCDGSIKSSHLFEGFLHDGDEIEVEMVLESNIFGMSNTAIRLTDCKKVAFDEDLLAVDWFFFVSLMLVGKRAIYSNKCKTFYRQHSSSMANIGSVSLLQLEKEISIKRMHYSLLAESCPSCEGLLMGVKDFDHQSEDFVREYFEVVKQKKKSPFWWSIFNVEEYWKIKDEINKKCKLI